MTSQRHQHNNHTTHYLHSIIDENEELRNRVSKFAQIQQYVEALLEKCEELSSQNSNLLTSKEYLLNELKSAERQIQQMSKRQSSEVQMVILEHDAIMKKMQQELHVLKVQTEREVTMNESLKQAKIKLQQEVEQLRVTVQLQDTEFEKEVAMLRNDSLQAQKQYQKVVQEYQEFRLNVLNEKQALVQEIYHLKAVTLREQNRYIEEIDALNANLKEESLELKRYNEDISRNAAMREKELRENVQLLKSEYNLKCSILNKELDALRSDQVHQQELNQKMRKEGDLLIDENIAKKRQIENYAANAEKLCRLLEESDKENQELRAKLKELDHFIETETEQYKRDFFNQKDHNSELRKILSQKQLQLNQKLREIKDLLNITDELEASLKLKDKESKLLNQDIKQVEEKSRWLQKQLEEKNYAIRALEEKNKAGRLSVDDMEVSNNLLKKQLLDLESANHNLRRELSNPRAISKEAEEKIEAIGAHYLKEKQRLVSEHQKEKDRIREMHALEIQQKQGEFLRKVEYFQAELNRLRV